MQSSNMMDLLEEMVGYMQAEAQHPEAEFLYDNHLLPNSRFISNIKFYGKPILPPLVLMTAGRKEEMGMHRRQAEMVETRIKAQVRQRLLARVQSIVTSMEERRTMSRNKNLVQSEASENSAEDDKTVCDEVESSEEREIVDDVKVTDEVVVTSKTDDNLHQFALPQTENVLEMVKHVDDTKIPAKITTNEIVVLPAESDKITVKADSTAGNERDSEEVSNFVSVDSGIMSKCQSTTPDVTESEQLDSVAEVTDYFSFEDTNDSGLPTLSLVSDGVPQGASVVLNADANVSSETLVQGQDNSDVIVDEDSDSPSSVKEQITAQITVLEDDNITEVKPDIIKEGEEQIAEYDNNFTADQTDPVLKEEKQIAEASEKADAVTIVQSEEPTEKSAKVDSITPVIVQAKHDNISIQAVAQSTSTCSSGTTISSEEMNRTVIARDEVVRVTDENIDVRKGMVFDDETDIIEKAIMTSSVDDGGASMYEEIKKLDYISEKGAADTIENQGVSKPFLPLLSKVAFIVDETSDSAPDTKSKTDGTSSESEATYRDDAAQGNVQAERSDTTTQVNFPEIEEESSRDESVQTDEQSTTETSDKSSMRPDEDGTSPISVSSGQSAFPLGGAVPTVVLEQGQSEINSSNTSISIKRCMQQATSVDTYSRSLYAYDTASTELAPYMVSAVSTNSTSTTLAQLEKTVDEVEDIPEECIYSPQDENIQSDVQKSGTNAEASHNKAIKNDSSTSNEKGPSSSSSHGQISSKDSDRVRRDSYTLDRPSPELVASEAKKKKEVTVRPITTCVAKEYPVTSSIEDLCLKPAQRKLDYDEISSTTASESKTADRSASLAVVQNEHIPCDNQKTKVSPPPTQSPDSSDIAQVKDGKQEHLQKYLDSLSQMPILPKKDNRPKSSLTSSTPKANKRQMHPAFRDKGAASAAASYGTRSLGFGSMEASSVNMQNSATSLPPWPSASTGFIPMPNLSMDFMNQMTQEDLLHFQMVQLEQMKQQLVLQQQQQLKVLMAEQETQQLLLQQEFMKQQQTLMMQTSPASVQKHQIDNVQRKSNISQSSEHRKPAILNHHLPVDEYVYEHQEANRPYSAPVGRPVSVHFADEEDVSELSYQNTEQNGGQYYHPGSQYIDSDQPSYEYEDNDHSISRHSSIRRHSWHHHEHIPEELHQKFAKLTAVAKGFLTRRLMKSEKVQHLLRTIQDTAEFALTFQQESPIKRGQYTLQDKNLQQSVLAQLTAAMYEIHEIFFDISVKERMALIAQTRALEHAKHFTTSPNHDKSNTSGEKPRISAATAKSIERKKKKVPTATLR